MANGSSFWMDTMLPSIATAGVSTLSNLAIMDAQNKFNAQQAQIARDWNLEQDNTKYQRAVVDMQKAGVNPALMMSKGPISTQAATNVTAQGATPAYMNMNAVASMAQSISQAKLNEAQARNLNTDSDLKEAQAKYYEASAGKTSEETIGVKIDNQFREESNQLEIQGKKLANSMTEERIKEVQQNIEVMKADVAKKLAEAKTEEEKVRLMITQEALNKASATRIEELLEYEKAYMAAGTEERKASAGFMLVQAAYQKGLIDEGMIEAAVREKNANASDAEQRAIINETKHALGIEKAEVSNTKSQTVRNYTGAVVDVVNGIANAFNTVLSVALKVPPGAVTPAAFIAQ